MEELKEYFNFKLSYNSDDLKIETFKDYDVLLIHEDYIKEDYFDKNLLYKIKSIKILVSSSNLETPDFFSDKLSLPLSIKDLNEIVENSVAKKNFNKNSSIHVKGYILDKNQKKLIKNKDFIPLTEKEIQLLVLLLNKKTSINKDEILKQVWKYAADVDTHTVETHIYRLRKKIKDTFIDDDFILNTKEGYLL